MNLFTPKIVTVDVICHGLHELQITVKEEAERAMRFALANTEDSLKKQMLFDLPDYFYNRDTFKQGLSFLIDGTSELLDSSDDSVDILTEQLFIDAMEAEIGFLSISKVPNYCGGKTPPQYLNMTCPHCILYTAQNTIISFIVEAYILIIDEMSKCNFLEIEGERALCLIMGDLVRLSFHQD